MSEKLRQSPPRPKRPSPSGKPRSKQQNHLHPFTGSSKVNFPGFDLAFKTGDLQRAVEAASLTPSPDPDRSTCSYGSSINNFSVDLSIGGRAALDEHRRHVNKYGIDGTPSRKSPSESIDTADDEWDRINDGNRSLASCSTFVEERSQISFLSQNQDLGASDFFDSSRVLCLETPERNKPIVDAASKLAQLGEGHVTERGAAHDESYVDSVIGSNSGSGTECDESGMAFLFHEAMRLNEDTQRSSFESSFQVADISRSSKEDSNGSKQCVDTSSSGKTSGSAKDSFIECEDGFEYVADLSDIVPDHRRIMTPSRNRKPRSDSYLTPQRSSRQTFKPPSAEKENAGDFNLMALSPIASKAGSIAANTLSSGAFNYDDGTPTRTPSRRTRRLPHQGGILTPKHAVTTPQQVTTSKSILSDSNFSAPTMEASNVSAISPMMSPNQGSNCATDQKEDRGSTCDKATDSLGRDCETKGVASQIPPFAARSERAFADRQGLRVPIKSLSARYFRPDRFEDNFTPPPLAHSLSSTASEEYGSGLKSASKSLLKSFDSSEF